jgi:uncharacterized protein (TIGR02466 family)
MSLIKEDYFSTPIYFSEKKEWIDTLNNHSDKYIEQAINSSKPIYDNSGKFGLIHHSTSLIHDDNFKDFCFFINNSSYYILDEQGFNLTNYKLYITELWVQEFSKEKGGYHIPHIHSNGHMSGFYFLKCSKNTSYPVFHDPRPKKLMIQLPQKNEKLITISSEKINIKPSPGLFVFFNSYLEHEFTLDPGIDPFRFIHFNVQALPKQIGL